MNYLAHIYLSGNNDELKIGNFMADSIKGKAYENYSGDLKNGILLHREIDTYTDAHPVVYKSAHRLFEEYRHYNGVIIDVFYDHFLAKNWSDYHRQNLADYVAEFYRLLEDNFERLPENVKSFYPYMKTQNWLLSYADIEGIKKILWQMSRRTKNGLRLDHSINDLNNYYSTFKKEFEQFFPDIKRHVQTVKNNLD